MTVHQAVHRLSALSAWTHHEAPPPVKERIYALMDAHKAMNAPARRAYADAVKLLGEVGVLEQALDWVKTHAGHGGAWPHAEDQEMRARLRVVAPEHEPWAPEYPGELPPGDPRRLAIEAQLRDE